MADRRESFSALVCDSLWMVQSWAFTVVSNDRDAKTARAALEMLKSAALRRVPN